MMMKRHVATIAVLLFLSLIQCSSANSSRSIFDGKSHITINQQQRSLRQSISEWSSSMYNKVHNKKNSGSTKKCMKKHWWNTHCDTASSTSSSSYSDGYNDGYEDGKSYTDGYNAGYDAASGSDSSSSSNASDGNDYDETDDQDTEDYEEDTSSSQAQDTSSSYIQTTQLDYTNNEEGGGGASVFLFFLAAFAGIAVGIAGMAIRRKVKKERQLKEANQQELGTITNNTTLQEYADSFTTYARENLMMGGGGGERTVVGTFHNENGDEENSIGKPAFIEVSSIQSKDSLDFGGGYQAPQEHVQVKVLYNA